MQTVINQYNKPLKRLPTIYIGYDDREHIAVEILIDSILKYASKPINIVTLNDIALRKVGLYRRAPDRDSTVWSENQLPYMIDSFDKKPFSTNFSFTRFLIPHLNMFEGHAIFMDCDQLVKYDIHEIFEKYADKQYAISCVKHNQEVKEKTKMYGCPQTENKTGKKNWSSFVLWNCEHPSNQLLTIDHVNLYPGSWLHNFSWLQEEEIGSLPEEWNWLEGHSSDLIIPKNIHFTLGGQIFGDKKHNRDIDKKYADEWHNIAYDYKNKAK